MNEEDFQRIDGMIARHIGGLAESVIYRLDELITGQRALLSKLDRRGIDLCQRIDRIAHTLELMIIARADKTGKQLDSVAADLKAHISDGEAHPVLYGVRDLPGRKED